ncbi:hypothetical protein [Chitinophaga sp. Cy-1792]|uniref:hypothetical protein n=1 Tax=Chitinophaga sp. Cy-1792 TaxID=2608339 RepID=UPI00141E5E27|nr:hypothetical protein [Chitinophaga sp. Cy-1792]NIG53557.1 hypothetical protein [Chitinophaga sp. Cy-1792]
MLIRSKQKYLHYVLMLAIPCVVASCGEGTIKKGNRKVMPGAYLPVPDIPGLPKPECTYATSDGQQAIPFRITQVDYSLDGTVSGFERISIPNERFDSIAFDMAETYRPMAAALLDHWAATNNKGIIIDLSQGKDAGLGVQYSVRAGDRNVPVVILWDNSGAARAGVYKHMIGAFPGIKEINTRQSAKMGTEECFK